jgi:hypothetical protein
VTRLTFAIPYYKNPAMLAHQYATWAAYPEAVKSQIEIVLVDDGSPEPAAGVPRPEGIPPLRIYRVLDDIPWHQHGARNLAAKEASGPWMLLTDMDHVMPAKSLASVLDMIESANPESVFTFRRVDAPKMTPTLDRYGHLKPHVNTFVLTKEKFWNTGGYDEDCVGYGTDSYFRRRLLAKQPAVHLDTIPIVRYPREVIADASTSEPGVDPKVLRDRGRRTSETKQIIARKIEKREPIKVLAFPWERVL